MSGEVAPEVALREAMIREGRCGECGWRTVVSGRGITCASCHRRLLEETKTKRLDPEHTFG